MKKSVYLFLVVALLTAAAIPAAADAVLIFTPSNGCGGSNCFGNTFELAVHPNGGKYDVTLTVDTAGNTNAGSAIAAVDFKFGGGITGGTLSSFDGGAPTGWKSGLGTLNANTGCNYSTNGSFECALDSAFEGLNASLTSINGKAYLSPATTHTWVWTGVTSAGPITATDLVHIGALFGKVESATKTTQTCTGSGKKKVCTSSTTTTYSFKQTGNLSGSGLPTVPEPASLSLLAAGLLGTGAWRRRHK